MGWVGLGNIASNMGWAGCGLKKWPHFRVCFGLRWHVSAASMRPSDSAGKFIVLDRYY